MALYIGAGCVLQPLTASAFARKGSSVIRGAVVSLSDEVVALKIKSKGHVLCARENRYALGKELYTHPTLFNEFPDHDYFQLNEVRVELNGETLKLVVVNPSKEMFIQTNEETEKVIAVAPVVKEDLVSLDMVLECWKRFKEVAVNERVTCAQSKENCCKEGGRELSFKESIFVGGMLLADGIEILCPACYEEQRRGRWIEVFLDGRRLLRNAPVQIATEQFLR